MERGTEANAVPYGAAYKSPLAVKAKGWERTLKVRVIITWEGQWYTDTSGPE